jgi:CRISPR-associated protein (TIGR03986 family)
MLTQEQYVDFGKASADELEIEQKLAHAPFFSTAQTEIEGYPVPAIPGSSLRGMIRTLVEIAGHGRMRWVADRPTFTFRAVAAARDDPLRDPYEAILGRYGSKVRAGYLTKRGEQWYVQPAFTPEDVGLPERDSYLKVKARIIDPAAIPGYTRFNNPKYHPGYYDVTFNLDVRSGSHGRYVAVTDIGSPDADHKYSYRATLVCSGNMMESNPGAASPRKNHALVLPPNKKAHPYTIPDQTLKDYLAGLTPYQKDELWGVDKKGCLKECGPVFYVLDGGEVAAFGHCPNFRVPAYLSGKDRAATPADFVPDELTDDPRPDLADAIFGWVEEEDGGPKGHRAGRVSFEDAHLAEAEEGIWLKPDPITPHVLSGPKPTTFQHYLVQDRTQGHNPDDRSSLAHYGTSPEETEIRGYKQYWHKGASPDLEADADEREHEKQLTRMMPLRPGVRFKFRLRFENLREEELGALIWALTLPGEESASYCHKLGMGKPLGMGAVSITVTSLCRTERRDRYGRLFDDGCWADGVQEFEVQPYVQAFEAYVLGELGIQEANRLSELKRIKMLLAMLRWREDDDRWQQATRYMEIEQGYDGYNEFKTRPVLPAPLMISEWADEQL